MNTSDLNLSDHLLRLTYNIDAANKISSLDYILGTNVINDRTVSGVLLTLNDRAEDDTLRKHGVTIILKMLEQAQQPEEKDCIMRHLMVRIFENYHDDFSVAHRDLFLALKRTIMNNIDEMDYLFVELMNNVNKVQKVNFAGDQLPHQIARFFEGNHQRDNLRSKRAFDQFSNHRHLSILFNDGTPLNTLEQTLEVLGERSFLNIDFDLMVAHLYPITNRKHPNAQRAVDQAITNISKWCSQFPKDRDSMKAQRIKIHNWFNYPNDHSIDELTRKQIGLNKILVPVLVEMLTEPKRQKTLCRPSQLFEILQNFNNLRKGDPVEPIKPICSFIDEAKKWKGQDFPYLAAIRFLESQLTGLDEYQPSQNSQTEQTQEERFRLRLFTKVNLDADVIIKETLLRIVRNEHLSDQVRTSAWSVFISAVPADLFETTNDHFTVIQNNDSLLLSTLEKFQRIHSLNSFPLITRLWSQRGNFEISIQKQIIRTLGAIGNFNITELLLPVAFDDVNEELKQLANDVLVNEGYEVEIVREAQRRKIEKLTSTGREVSLEILSNEEKNKIVFLDIKRTQIAFNENSSELVLHQNEFNSFIIGSKIDVTENSLDQVVINRKLTVLVQKIGVLYEEISAAMQRMNERVDESENILSSISNIEKSIDHEDRKLRKSRKERIEEQRKVENYRADQERLLSSLQKLSQESQAAVRKQESTFTQLSELRRKQNNLDSEVRQLQKQASSSENGPNYALRIKNITQKQTSNKRKLSDAEKSNKKITKERNSIDKRIKGQNRNLESTQDKISSSKSKISRIEREIPRLESNISNLQSRHAEVARKLKKVGEKIAIYRNKINKQNGDVNILKAEVRELENELSAITTALQTIKKRRANELKHRRDHLENLNKNGLDLVEHNNELGKLFVETETVLNALKTEKQRITQQIESERAYYDQIGDRANKESIVASLRSTKRSNDTAAEQTAGDEIRLAKDQVVSRSSNEFESRYPSTTKLKKKLSSK
jgi:hypothetical protein